MNASMQHGMPGGGPVNTVVMQPQLQYDPSVDYAAKLAAARRENEVQ